MFGISFPELIVIAIVLLLVVGPNKLPELAHTIGGWAAKLRKNSDKLRREFYNSVYEPTKDSRDALSQVTRDLRSVKDNFVNDILLPPLEDPKDPPPHDENCPDCNTSEKNDKNKS